MYVMCTKLLKNTQFYTHIVTLNDTDKQTYTKTHTLWDRLWNTHYDTHNVKHTQTYVYVSLCAIYY